MIFKISNTVSQSKVEIILLKRATAVLHETTNKRQIVVLAFETTHKQITLPYQTDTHISSVDSAISWTKEGSMMSSQTSFLPSE